MSRPHTYENTVRLFDETLSSWVGGLTVDYGALAADFGDLRAEALGNRPILHTFASPERAFAEMQELLVRKDFLETSQATDDFRNVPLPFATIYSLGPIQRNRDIRPPAKLRVGRTLSGSYDVTHFPTPFDFPYEITYWTLKRYSIVHVQDWVLSQLAKRGASPSEFYLTVQHDKYAGPNAIKPNDIDGAVDVFGTVLHSVRVDAMTDLSDVEPVNITYRYFRLSVMLTFRAWVMHPIEPGAPIQVQIGQCYEDGAAALVQEDPLAPSPNPIVLSVQETTDNLLNLLGSPPLLDTTDDVEVTFHLPDYTATRPEYHRFNIDFPDGGGEVQTAAVFPLPLLRLDRPCTFGGRLEYLLPSGAPDVRLEVLRVDWESMSDVPNDPDPKFRPIYSVSQSYPLDFTPDVWNRLEFFGAQENDIALRIVADGEVHARFRQVGLFIRESNLVSDEFVDDSDMEDSGTASWTAVGGATLTKETDTGGNQYLKVVAPSAGDGFSQDVSLDTGVLFALLRAQLLQVVGGWRILLANDAASPTHTFELDDVDENWTNAGLIAAPKDLGGTLKVTFEALDPSAEIHVDDLSIRAYQGAVFGTAVPIL